MGNAAPTGIRRHATNQPSRKQRGYRACHQDEQKTRRPLLLRPRNQVIAPLVRMLKCKPGIGPPPHLRLSRRAARAQQARASCRGFERVVQG